MGSKFYFRYYKKSELTLDVNFYSFLYLIFLNERKVWIDRNNGHPHWYGIVHTHWVEFLSVKHGREIHGYGVSRTCSLNVFWKSSLTWNILQMQGRGKVKLILQHAQHWFQDTRLMGLTHAERMKPMYVTFPKHINWKCLTWYIAVWMCFVPVL